MSSPRSAPRSPGELVCRCNGVSRADVQRSIERGRDSVQAIAADTSAGASCGSCRKQVGRMLRRMGVAQDNGIASVCSCTDLDHEALRELIRRERFASVDAVLAGPHFRDPDGCARCRPAINYYLLCADPRGYQDDMQSRVANERNHANLQRDGSYSVVPRIFGGVISPEQLRAIADAAERFQVKMVKLTGAQRIDLLGVPGEQLTGLWKALGEVGLVSGHAYARGVRSVKTCVGEEYCRYGLADAVRVGIELEELLWSSWTPHKFKLAVSACARNCAEATIKDLGVVAVEQGWDIYVGGTSGMRVRAGRRVARVESERVLMEYVGGFVQLYREEGHYGERSGAFVERVGIDYVRERLIDPHDRGNLFRAFYASQRDHQEDPWKARVEAGDATGLVPIRRLTRRAS